MTTRSVMFVDDEPAVLAVLARLFQRYSDLKVYVAAGALDALRKLQLNRMDLVVTDFLMPGMNGLELLDEVFRLYPWTRGAILSAYPEVRGMLRSRQGKPLPPFFSKPWDNKAFRRAIRRLLGLATQEEADETPSRAAA